ncbi:hypothetical protein M8C21_023969, partial [Ambrosia artemisiifolia]
REIEMDAMRMEAFLRISSYLHKSDTRYERDNPDLEACLKWVKDHSSGFKAVVYMIFGASTGSLMACVYAITGERHLFWMKLCNKFNRFCIQIGGALLCGYVAFLLMAVVSFLSAYSLFRHYSPKTFLVLK